MEQQQATVNGKSIVRRTEEEIVRHLSDQEASGFSVKEYCEMFSINEVTFYSWVKKYRKNEEEEKGFTSIEIVPPVRETKPELFAEVGSIRLYREVSAEYLKALVV